jgi:hypothetical protein
LIGFNDLNGAQRLNVWNDWNGLQYFSIMVERLEQVNSCAGES